MTEAEMRAVFLLAGFEVLDFERIENQYWPDVPAYTILRAASPWWIVRTEYGKIRIGDRKRVCRIEWSSIGIVSADTLIKDETTTFDYGVDAWTRAKIVEYLTDLRKELQLRLDSPRDP